MKRILDVKFLLTRAWKISKGYCVLMAMRNILNALLPLVNIIGLGTVVNALMLYKPYNKIMEIIIIYLSVNLGVVVIKEIFQLAENRYMRKVSNATQFEFSEDCVNVNYHYAQDGTVMNLRRKSMSAYPAFYLDHLGQFLYYIVQFLGILSILSMLSPLFLVVLSMTSALSITLIFKTKKYEFEFQNDKVEEDRKLEYLYKVMTDYKFAKEVRINNAEAFIANKYFGILQTQIEKLKTLFAKSLKISSASAMISIAQTALMYFYFSYQVFNKNITIAEYTVLLSTTSLLALLLLGFFEKIAAISRVCKAIEFYRKYKNLLETQSNIIESNKLEEKEIDFSQIVIKYENISFSYPNTEKIILKNISFEIRTGEKIGIVGLNGSGKTTFIKLLTRIYDPIEGRITLNGIDIREIPYHQYIKHIGVVLQDFLLFAYSVKENIVLDTEYDEKKLMSSIEKSGVKEKIKTLWNGVNTSVYKTLDENGIEFSGGEGQKLALARALYKDTEILVLDEPTSSLDPIAEYELFSRLHDISENKAVIFISHRLSSTKYCDKIIVLSEGMIIEHGSHDELICKNGYYTDLFYAQAQYYQENKGDKNA